MFYSSLGDVVRGDRMTGTQFLPSLQSKAFNDVVRETLVYELNRIEAGALL